MGRFVAQAIMTLRHICSFVCSLTIVDDCRLIPPVANTPDLFAAAVKLREAARAEIARHSGAA